jgi:predicted MFS family arabinose efflux permease
MQMEEKLNAKFTAYQYFLVIIFALVQFIIALDFMIIVPIGDLLMKKLNGNPAEFSLIVSSY